MTSISISFVLLIALILFVMRKHLRTAGKTVDEGINHLDKIVKVNLMENEVDLIRRLNKVNEDMDGLNYKSFEEAYAALKNNK